MIISRQKRVQRIQDYTTVRGAELDESDTLKKGIYVHLLPLVEKECRFIHPSWEKNAHLSTLVEKRIYIYLP